MPIADYFSADYPNARERLDQFHPQVSTDRPRRPCQRSERHRLVLGIEQPIKLTERREITAYLWVHPDEEDH